jgi:hypothetical protein
VSAAQANQVDVVTPQIGEVVDLDREFVSRPWWETVR